MANPAETLQCSQDTEEKEFSFQVSVATEQFGLQSGQFLTLESGDELCNKNCIVNTSEMLITSTTSCYTAGSDKSDAIEGAPD